MIKILIVDDQMILAEGIKSVLETCPDFKVLGIASDGAEAVAFTGKHKPDVVLMDIRMPNMNPPDSLEKQHFPPKASAFSRIPFKPKPSLRRSRNQANKRD